MWHSRACNTSSKLIKVNQLCHLCFYKKINWNNQHLTGLCNKDKDDPKFDAATRNRYHDMLGADMYNVYNFQICSTEHRFHTELNKLSWSRSISWFTARGKGRAFENLRHLQDRNECKFFWFPFSVPFMTRLMRDKTRINGYYGVFRPI